MTDENENLREIDRQWTPILFYLQENPHLIGAKVGDRISEKLLKFLKDLNKRAQAPLPGDDEVDRVAKAIFFAGRSAQSITPYHPNEATRKQAEGWWINPPNKDYVERKNDAVIEARAAISALDAHRKENGNG